MKKREWMYIQKPYTYEISCDKCGGSNIEWSEYEGMIWCYACEVDTKGTDGIFNGPIPLNLCKSMGISFDRFRFSDKKILKMVSHDGKIEWIEDEN